MNWCLFVCLLACLLSFIMKRFEIVEVPRKE